MASRPGRPLLVQDRFHAVGRMWVVNVWDQGQDGGSGDVGKERRGEGREEAATMAQIHVTLHRAARSLGEMWKGGCFLLPALSTRFV